MFEFTLDAIETFMQFFCILWRKFVCDVAILTEFPVHEEKINKYLNKRQISRHKMEMRNASDSTRNVHISSKQSEFVSILENRTINSII